MGFTSLASQKYKRLTQKILQLETVYRDLSDNQLKDKTQYYRDQLAAGKRLDDLLIEAYATVREADYRVLGMRPFAEQTLGAVFLHFGNVAEMKTGEGKTLTATLPLYLNGLAGPGTFLVTANPYLANRDAEEIGRVYEWLGLTVGPGVAPNDDQEIDGQEAYQKDIVYTTNSQIGFDYLIDNLVESTSEKKQQGFKFALIDEADSVLLDTAQTPLVISGAPKVQSNLYLSADNLVRSLIEDEDYKLSEDTKSSWFTPTGIKNMEVYLGITGLLSDRWEDMYRHLVLALRANTLMHRNRDYVVDHNEVYLLDQENGRELEGIKLEAGLHQAIEAKERTELSQPTRSMASITYQNLFRMFPKLAGMTGTAKTAAHEFMEMYNLPVLAVPTHKPNRRIDHRDRVLLTLESKIDAVIELIRQSHAEDRPVLVETGSVSLSRLYSRMLLREGIDHNVLNAQSAAKEATIIAEAGQAGAVTIATAMAGRGTDIKLGPGVPELGGLLVIGTERMANRRIDDQLRGRAGRQGDPGESVFYASLEDKVVVENAPDWVEHFRLKRLEKSDEANQSRSVHRKIQRIINQSQRNSENRSESGRASGGEYEAVLKRQREVVYQFRDTIIASDNLSVTVQNIIKNATTVLVNRFSDSSGVKNGFDDYVLNHLDDNYLTSSEHQQTIHEKQSVENLLTVIIDRQMERRHQSLPDEFQLNYFQRLSILKAIDMAWVDQVDTLQQLKVAISNQSSGMRNIAYTYERDAKKSFESMKNSFWENALKNLCLAEIVTQKNGSVKVVFP